jgi:Pol polyprotein, beta-barrel domain/GAG-pre-integrase domain
MMANITEIAESESTKITLSTYTSALSAIQDRAHMWLIDSAASSHICGDLDLFEEIHSISSISVKTASGDSFIANQRGTIRIIIQSDTHMSLQPVALTLQNVIFIPKLNVNLLSVGRMTSADVDVMFSKTNTSLLLDGDIIARGKSINNLFAYMALSPLQVTKEAANYHGELNSLTLWHHRLSHIAPSTIERMWKMETAEGVSSVDVSQEMSRCANCPFGKQTCLPFKRIEPLPEKIGDIILSDLCSPFKTSIGGYK